MNKKEVNYRRQIMRCCGNCNNSKIINKQGEIIIICRMMDLDCSAEVDIMSICDKYTED